MGERGEGERVRLKTSPAAGSKPSAVVKGAVGESVMVFGFDQYPFPNDANSPLLLLRTVVNLSLSTERLEKVIKLTHPNIVALRKIVRSSPREPQPSARTQTYYSFYY